MLKKMMLLATAIAAITAFAVPAAAQASGLITDSEGNAVPVEAELTASSTNTVSVTGVGELKCATVNLNLHVTENTTTTAQATGTGTAIGEPSKPLPHGEHCEAVQAEKTVKITEIQVKNIHLNGGGSGTASFKYVFDITEVVNGCFLESDGPTTVTYTPTSDTVKISGKMKGGPAPPCPAAGSISGDFTILGPNGQPVSIH